MNLEQSKHPAQLASAMSRRNVMGKNRAAWIDLFADDAVVQDPVGVSPLDPSGGGHRGKEAIGRFWDMVIAPGNVEMIVRESYPAGDECAKRLRRSSKRRSSRADPKDPGETRC